MCVITVSCQICPTCAAHTSHAPFCYAEIQLRCGIRKPIKITVSTVRHKLLGLISTTESQRPLSTAIIQKSTDGLFVLASLRNCSQGDETLPNLTARPPGGYTWSYIMLRGPILARSQ